MPAWAPPGGAPGWGPPGGAPGWGPPGGAPGWGPPPPEEAPAKLPGVTAKGLPLHQRGGISVDVAGLVLAHKGFGNNGGPPIASIDVNARIPIGAHTFIDANLPIGFGAVGNPMVGAHHVFRPDDRFWIHLGGAVGFPLINVRGFETFAQAKAFWDMQSFTAQIVPFAIRFGMEGHVGIAEFRGELDPVWGVSIASAQSHLFAFQHAVEIQLGHEIGGGLRYQGVVTNQSLVATNDNQGFPPSADHYQGAFEPFFRIYHDPIFLRLGLLLPIDKPLGAPFDNGWGVRATTGFCLD